MNYLHTVTVTRKTSTVANKTETFGPTQIHASLPCLIEPLPARKRAELGGTYAGRIFVMTWGTEDVRTEDVVTWNARRFRVEYQEDDRYRGDGALIEPYQTAYLYEEP